MLLVVDVCAPPPPPPPTVVVVVEFWEDGDEDEGELPRPFPPLFPVEEAGAPVCAALVAADDEDADALDGVFEFELRICAQVGFDGEG